jgi:hypothetical protein
MRIVLTPPVEARDQDFAVLLELKSNGWKFDFPDDRWWDWETPSELCSRLRISAETFRRKINSPLCPTFIAERCPGGRFRRLMSNFFLDHFLAVPLNRQKSRIPALSS